MTVTPYVVLYSITELSQQPVLLDLVGSVEVGAAATRLFTLEAVFSLEVVGVGSVIEVAPKAQFIRSFVKVMATHFGSRMPWVDISTESPSERDARSNFSGFLVVQVHLLRETMGAASSDRTDVGAPSMAAAALGAVSLVGTICGVVALGWFLPKCGPTIFTDRIRARRHNRSTDSTTCRSRDSQPQTSPSDSASDTASAYELQIGNTPCILLPNLSKVMKCEIYAKMESANPGATGKDRAALAIIEAAEREGRLPPSRSIAQDDSSRSDISNGVEERARVVVETNESYSNDQTYPTDEEALYDRLILKAMQRSITGGLIVEGTSGSTGISLATLAATKGHACLVVLPDDQAQEKTAILETLSAVTYTVPTASIASPNHYVNIAKSLCRRACAVHHIAAIFGNQFESNENWQIHYQTTGPEIWRQCRPHHFVMSAGTGGTLAGVARYLKEQQPRDCHTVLVDPPGSVLYSKIEHGVAFCVEQRERHLKRHRYDTVAEGIGLDRVTANVAAGLPYIDQAMAITDQQAVDLAHWMLRHEGLLLGSSSAMNLVGACLVARQQQEPSQATTTRICTVICDTGQRHLTRFWNRDFIASRGLEWPGDQPSRRQDQLPAILG